MPKARIALPELSFSDVLNAAPPKPRPAPLGEQLATLFGFRMNPKKSAFILIYGAAAADGRISPEEALELDALIGRSPTLSRLTAPARDKLMRKYGPRLMNPERRTPLIAKAARSIPRQKRLAVFAHAADLILGDRIVLISERQYIKDLIELLGLDEDSAATMLSALRKKNSY